MLKIRTLREECRLSKNAVANDLGLLRPTYSRYEDEINQMPYDLLLKIADYFGVSLDYIFGRTNEKKMVSEQTLTEKEERLLRAFDDLIEPMQDYTIKMIEGLTAQAQNRRKA